jgi:DNA invertase Pin-like site-specific DNA recombinase
MKSKGGRPRAKTDDENLVRLYSELKSLRQVARIVGLSRTTVLRRLREKGGVIPLPGI